MVALECGLKQSTVVATCLTTFILSATAVPCMCAMFLRRLQQRHYPLDDTLCILRHETLAGRESVCLVTIPSSWRKTHSKSLLHGIISDLWYVRLNSVWWWPLSLRLSA